MNNMEIIKNNHNSFEVTCERCTSVLRIDAKDLKGGDVCSYYFVCAACKKESEISTFDIPRHIFHDPH